MKKGSFKHLKKDSQEEPKEVHSDEVVKPDLSLEIEEKDLQIDRLQTAIDNLQDKLEVQRNEFNAERGEIQEIVDSLNYKFKLKNQDISTLQTQIQKQATLIENQASEILDLKKNKGVVKPLPSGLKTRLDKQKINDMKEYALSLADDKQNFYKQIAEKFGVSIGSAYNYTRDIYEAKFKGESSND